MRSLLPDANLLLHLEILCSDCHTFATVYTNAILHASIFGERERESNQPPKMDGKSDSTVAHTI